MTNEDKAPTMGDLQNTVDKLDDLANKFRRDFPGLVIDEPEHEDTEPFDYWNDPAEDRAAYNHRLASELCR